MKSKLLIDNKNIYYSEKGHGITVVLLHGYLESLETWESFSIELSKKYRVISFDIPGHGDSEIISDSHSMEDLSNIILKSLNKLKVDKCFIIGHSMGGYLTLMIHKLYPELLLGFCLFHSHPFADTEETKKKRVREIAFVKEGKKNLIATFNIPNAFATDNLHFFKSEIEEAIKTAIDTTKEGIIANLYAMMNRPDLSESLEKSNLPFLYILGEKDNYIDLDTIIPAIRFPVNFEFHVLNKSGHMGFIEEKTEVINIILKFFLKNFK